MFKKIEKSTICFLCIACLLLFGVVIITNAENNMPNVAFAEEAVTSSSQERNQTTVNIDMTPISNFTNVKMIENSNYFYMNPLHSKNDGSDNPKGTCTTVAMQLLMGYHNYYSDRRLIPEVADGVRFLNESYGDLSAHPDLNNSHTNGLGNDKIGTEEAVYRALFNLTTWPEFIGIGQNIPAIKNAANKFVEKYAYDIHNKVVITSDIFKSNEAKSDINAGNPIVLGFTPTISGADNFHVVIAYGYATLDGVEGYIVHMGTYGDETQVWVPSNWFGYQIRMAVNHRHNFVDEGNYANNNTFRQIVCSTCGLRTIDKIYETNFDGNEIICAKYPLSGDVTIPSSLYGKIITKIGNAAFSGQLCQKIILPKYVTTIANDAFSNCINLTSITNLNNLEEIGNKAFYGCNNLENIFLPTCLEQIGIEAFHKCNNLNINVSSNNPNYFTENNILYSKDKTQLISACKIPHELTILRSVSEILPYAFEGNTNLNNVRFYHNPIIGEFAFSDCSNLDSVYFYPFDIPTDMRTNCFSKNDFTLYTPQVSQELYQNAFIQYANRLNAIVVQIMFVNNEDILITKDVNYGSIINELPVPTKAGFTFQGWFSNTAFEGEAYHNEMLWENTENISLYAKWGGNHYQITFAGEKSDALESKDVIYDLAIGELPSISKIGYTFLGWKSPSGVFYYDSTIYTVVGNITLTSEWQANEYTITYNGNGGSIPSIATQPVEYDSTVDELASCQRDGYTFLEWNTVSDGSGQSVATPFLYSINSDITLYAQWQAVEYGISYDLDGGILETPNPVAYTILSNEIIFNNPIKAGYTFVNWKNGNDIVTNIPTGSYGNVNLVANWTANQYTVTLDPNGGTNNGSNSFIVTYNSAFNLQSTPTKTGYTFEGWYDNNNIKYMTATGESTKLWDKASNAILYAHWAVKSYEIQINNNGTITWLGASGLSNVQCSIEYGTVLSAINLISTFKQSSQGYKEGKIFDHFAYNGANVNWTSIPDLGVNGAIITILPVWVLEAHTIYFNTLFSATINPIIANYDADITLPGSVNRDGYTFKGWYASATGGARLSWTKMPDLTPDNQNNGSITLYAQYDLISYSITYNMDGGTNSASNPSIYNIESVVTLQNPTKTGYVFGGWFLDAEKTIQMTELRNSYGSKNIYAKWIAVNYSIHYHSNNGLDNAEVSNHTFNVAQNLRANTFAKTGYYFIGWAMSSNGTVVYENTQSVINLSNLNNSVVDLYALWQAYTYTISYNANGGVGSMNSSSHTYNSERALYLNCFTKIGYNFAGWAISEAGDVRYSDCQNVKNLTTIQNATVVLFAKWIPKSFTITFDKQGGVGGTDNVVAIYDSAMPSGPSVNACSRVGYAFNGYYSKPNGEGLKYYNINMTSAKNWSIDNNATLYAYWIVKNYNVTFDNQGGSGVNNITVIYDSPMPSSTKPSRIDGIFEGYFTEPQGKGIMYYDSKMNSTKNWDIASNSTLYAKWRIISEPTTIYFISDLNDFYNSSIANSVSYRVNYGSTISVTAPNISGYKFQRWVFRGGAPRQSPAYFQHSTSQTLNISYSYLKEQGKTYRNCDFCAVYKPDKCVAKGTLITLSDGTQKAVETLTGKEQLLVWNLMTGSFDTAPILFIDNDPEEECEVINLYFSDGTVVKVISEHGFWDFDLNRYVFLRSDAAQYIGHWFNKQIPGVDGSLAWTRVQLERVVVQNELTTTWSPVTYGHLCYYVNGMLTMPGATTGFINIFDVNPETMKIDQTAFDSDIAEYGLFTYEEFAALYPIPESIFEAFGGQYLKVAMGKGLLTEDMLASLIERYAPFFDADNAADNDSDASTDNGNHYGHSNGNHGNHYGHTNGNNGNHNGRANGNHKHN